MQVLDFPKSLENAHVCIGVAGTSVMLENDTPVTVQGLVFITPSDITVEMSNGAFIDINTLCEFYENNNQSGE